MKSKKDEPIEDEPTLPCGTHFLFELEKLREEGCWGLDEPPFTHEGKTYDGEVCKSCPVTFDKCARCGIFTDNLTLLQDSNENVCNACYTEI